MFAGSSPSVRACLRHAKQAGSSILQRTLRWWPANEKVRSLRRKQDDKDAQARQDLGIFFGLLSWDENDEGELVCLFFSLPIFRGRLG